MNTFIVIAVVIHLLVLIALYNRTRKLDNKLRSLMVNATKIAKDNSKFNNMMEE